MPITHSCVMALGDTGLPSGALFGNMVTLKRKSGIVTLCTVRMYIDICGASISPDTEFKATILRNETTILQCELIN